MSGSRERKPIVRELWLETRVRNPKSQETIPNTRETIPTRRVRISINQERIPTGRETNPKKQKIKKIRNYIQSELYSTLSLQDMIVSCYKH